MEQQSASEEPSTNEDADADGETPSSQGEESLDRASYARSEDDSVDFEDEGEEYHLSEEDSAGFEDESEDEDEFAEDPEETESSGPFLTVATPGGKPASTSYAATKSAEPASQTDVALLALRQRSTFQRPFDSPLFNTITISDDQSAGSKIAERILLALRDRKNSPKPSDLPVQPVQSHQTTRPQDHLRQVMLLKQHNRRVMMARLEQDAQNRVEEGNTPANAGIVSSSPAGEATSPMIFQNNGTSYGVADMQHLPRADNPSQLDLKQLQEYIELLQTQVKQMELSQQDVLPSRFQILNRIMQKDYYARKGQNSSEWQLSSPYFDEPEWIEGQGPQRQLRCSLPVTNFELYLEKNKDIAFIVYRDFHPAADMAGSDTSDRPAKSTGAWRPLPRSETIRPVGQVLIEAIETLLSSRDEYSSLLQNYKDAPELQAPYLTVYNSRKDLDTIKEGLSPEGQKQFSLLLQYITDQYGDRYEAADSLFSENKISSANMPYLFKPGDILVERKQTQYAAFVASSWPMKGSSKYVSRLKGNVRTGDHLPLYGSHAASKRVANENTKVQNWSVTGWSWSFDGNFQRQNCKRHFDIEVGEETRHDTVVHEHTAGGQYYRIEKSHMKKQNIKDLKIFPLAYAEPDLVDRLQKRGRTFWKCRNRLLVSYMEKGIDNSQSMVSFLSSIASRSNRCDYAG